MMQTVARWWREEDGAIAPFLVMMLIPIIGMVALGGEVSGWYMKQRQVQNAADSAALAAAANGSTTTINGVPSYKREAFGVAGTYGFKNTGDTVVTPTTVTCPGGSGTCFQVSISTRIPLYLTQIVGYKGNATLSSDATKMATTVAAFAIASPKTAYNYCMTGLGTSDSPINGSHGNVDLRGNGGDFSQCAAQTKGNISCTSVDFAYIQAPTEQGHQCDPDYNTVAASAVTDPYSSKNFTSAITTALGSTSCYGGALTGTIIASVVKICSSNNTMTGPITIQAPTGSDPPILVIYDTTLNTAGFAVNTTTGLGATGGTVIVTGAGAAGSTNSNQWFSGNGNVTVQGASGGAFDDMAIIVDPKYANAQSFNPGGGSHVNLYALGTIYAPQTDVAIQGSMSSTIGSYRCVAIVAKSVYVNGGSLDNNPLDCKALGYNLAEVVISRQALVG